MKRSDNNRSEIMPIGHDKGNSSKKPLYFSLDDLVSVTDFCRNLKYYTAAISDTDRHFILTNNGRPLCGVVPLSSLQDNADY